MLRKVLLLSAVVAASTSVGGWTGSALASSGKQGSATFVVSGRGFGHGVGMGAYGMYGYAKHGWGYKKILAHYYRHTALARMTIPQVRVLLAQGSVHLTISS